MLYVPLKAFLIFCSDILKSLSYLSSHHSSLELEMSEFYCCVVRFNMNSNASLLFLESPIHKITKSCLVLILIFIAYERNLLQFYIQMH